MAGGVLKLSWTDFERNCPSTFQQLWNNNEFTDVTLATEDNGQIQAHKVILSSSSPFFRKLLCRNPHQNLLIYLKGVQLRDLESVLQYIYKGSCEVLNENIEDFIRTGRDLHVEGLVEKGGEVEEQALDEGSVNENSEFHEPVIKDEIVSEVFEDLNNDSEENDLDTKNLPKHSTLKLNVLGTKLIEYEQSDGVNAILHTEEEQIVDRQWDSQEQEGILIKCDQCEYIPKGNVSVRRINLKQHKEAIHQGTKYDCNHCEYKAGYKTNLREHMLRMHETRKFKCDQCDYKASLYYRLKQHIESQHAGLRYKCEECDYKVGRKDTLAKHFNKNHVKVFCDMCDVKPCSKIEMKQHKDSEHTGLAEKIVQFFNN